GYAHDLDVAFWASWRILQSQVLTEGISVAETSSGKRLIHDRNHGRAVPIALVDFATQQQGNLHGGEEAGPNGQDAAVLSGGAGHADSRSASACTDQGMIRETCGADTRDGVELRPKVVVEGDNLRVLVSGLPGVQLERQHV